MRSGYVREVGYDGDPPRRICKSVKKLKAKGVKKMRRLIATTAILVFMATASMGIASTNMKSHRGYWISGQVTAIENGAENSLVTMNLPDGQIFRFSSTNQKLEGIRIGDRISVRDVKGWAAHIEKRNMKLAKSSPESTKKQ